MKLSFIVMVYLRLAVFVVEPRPQQTVRTKLDAIKRGGINKSRCALGSQGVRVQEPPQAKAFAA